MKAEHSMKSDQKGKMKNYYDSLKVSHGLPHSLADCDTLVSSFVCTQDYSVLYWEPSLLTPLQEAHKMVDFVLRHGNDLLAVECLRGFEVSQQIQQVDSRSPVPRVLPSFHLLSVELGQVPKVLS